MDFLIITGGGKSQAADIIEDLDYYCVDNMPVALIPKFAELCAATKGRYEKVALVTDIREKNGIKDIFNALETLREMDFGYKILFMEAKPSVIVKRYKESRRPHPGGKVRRFDRGRNTQGNRAAAPDTRHCRLYHRHLAPDPRAAAQRAVHLLFRLRYRPRDHGKRHVLRL